MEVVLVHVGGDLGHDCDVPRSIPAPVEPQLLRWAREMAGFTEVAASRKMNLPDDRVEAWEAGRAVPTVAQLRKAAETYKRSLAVFFLSEPPRGFETPRDFRRLVGAQSVVWSPALHDDFRRAHEEREVLLELAELDEVEPPQDWQIDDSSTANSAIASAARDRLLAIGPLPIPESGDRPYEHLNAWIAALETAGVLVMATGGGRVPLSEMRAFSLYFEQIPVIVVNGVDGPRGRLFSLLHEYAHLLLHSGGLCDATTDQRAVTPNRRLEARCNDIAAQILMPEAAVLNSPVVRRQREENAPWTYALLRQAAGPFGVSAEAFLLRLVSMGLVSQTFYNEQKDAFEREYELQRENERSPGGNWYRNTVRDRGKGFVRQVTAAHERSLIDTYTAASFLDVKASQLRMLAETASIANVESA